MRPPRPPPPVRAPSPLAAVVAAGGAEGGARRRLGREGGRREGGGPAAPRPLPWPSPHHGAERGGGGGGAGPGAPAGWVSAARSGPGGGGRGRRCERGCERASVSVCPRRCGGPGVHSRGPVCAGRRRVRRLLVWPSGCVLGVEPRCWVRPCVCPPEWLFLRLCVWGLSRAHQRGCVQVCVRGLCAQVWVAPSQCVRAASCVGCLCPGWMSIRGSLCRVCPLGCPFVRVCVRACVSAGCMSPRVCVCATTSGSWLGGWGWAPCGSRPLCGFVGCIS